MASETSRTGVPLLRPFVFDFPQDQAALDEVHSYMFGRALHVAPVTEPGAKTWPVYLPQAAGGWFDLWTGEHREGGKTYDVAAPLEQIPLHARAGSIIPMGPVLQTTADATNGTIDLYVVTGRDASFDLYEDQGLDNSYETGACAIITIRWNDARSELEIDERRGSYEGMLVTKQFVVRKVSPRNTLISTGSARTVDYSGPAMSVTI